MNSIIEIYKYQDQKIKNAIDRIVVEAYKKKKEKGSKTFLLTGCSAMCGTTTNAIHFAVALAEAGWKTILVDCDLRKGMEYKHLSEDAQLGLSDFMSGEQECRYPTNVEKLHYLPCGSRVENPVRLLCSPKMEQLISQMKEQYDFIVFDFPSVNIVPDAEIFIPFVDEVILVAALDETDRKQLQNAKKCIPGKQYMGIVVNKVSKTQYQHYLKDYDHFEDQKIKNRYKNGMRKKNLRTARNKRKAGKLLSIGILLLTLLGNNATAMAAGGKGRVLVDSYSVTKDVVSPYEEFDLLLNLQNQNQVEGATEILVTVTEKENRLSPVYGESNQRYIALLEPQQSVAVTFPMILTEQCTEDLLMLQVQIDSVGETGFQETTNHVEIQIPVEARSELLTTEEFLPECVNVQSKTRISILAKNQGQEDLSNVKLVVKGEGLEKDEITVFGPLLAGDTGRCEAFLVFDEPGIKNLYYSIMYEDSKGNQCETVAENFTINVVQKMEKQSVNTEFLEEADGSVSFSIIQILLIIAICAIALLLILFAQAGKRRE